MFKFVVLTIFLISSPTFGLLENLFQSANNCYSGCRSNYADNLLNINACGKGCDFKLYKENCADQCKFFSLEEQLQASCLVGCSMNEPIVQQLNENEHPRSIIFVRLRQRPSFRLLPLKNDPVQTFNDIIKQLKDNANTLEQTNELQTVVNLAKNIPMIKSTDEIQSDSSVKDANELTRVYVYQNKLESFSDRCKRFFESIHSKIPIWILLTIFILSSIMLWYMTVLLCCHTPKHRNLSLHAQEVVIDNIYENEKMQPNEIKLGNN